MIRLPVTIESTLVGPDRTLSVAGFFRLFQDAAIKDAEQIGYGHEETDKEGLLWVFTRVRAVFPASMDYLSKGNFETHPIGKKGFAYLRAGTLLSEDGGIKAQVSSIWALIHAESRRVELHPSLEDLNESNGHEIDLPGKIVPRHCKLFARRTVHYSDLDLNGHMNNIRYITLIEDLHGPDFYRQNRIAEILVNYESEIHYGETIEVLVDEKMEYVKGIVEDRVAFEAEVKYAQK